MIDTSLLRSVVEQAIEGTDNYLVDLNINPSGTVSVEIDNDNGVDIDTCATITRAIEQAMPELTDDFSLEVGSAGLTSPLKIKRQYIKNIGKKVSVLTKDGRKLKGLLTAVSPTEDSFTLEYPVKVTVPGKKRPQTEMTSEILPMASCKKVQVEIEF